MIYNISDPNKYYRQNNNEIKPSIRCKPTATVQGLDLAGWGLPTGKYVQPEDNLTAWMEKTYGKDSPEEWSLLTKAINEHFLPGKGAIIGPRWAWRLEEALFGLTRFRPFVASTFLTPAGHVVNVVGFKTRVEESPVCWQSIRLDDVESIIIDDPYGDRTSGKYDVQKTGFNNAYSTADFLKLWRGIGIQIRRNA
jgi:hypothetical protein